MSDTNPAEYQSGRLWKVGALLSAGALLVGACSTNENSDENIANDDVVSNASRVFKQVSSGDDIYTCNLTGARGVQNEYDGNEVILTVQGERTDFALADPLLSNSGFDSRGVNLEVEWFSSDVELTPELKSSDALQMLPITDSRASIDWENTLPYDAAILNTIGFPKVDEVLSYEVALTFRAIFSATEDNVHLAESPFVSQLLRSDCGTLQVHPDGNFDVRSALTE